MRKLILSPPLFFILFNVEGFWKRVLLSNSLPRTRRACNSKKWEVRSQVPHALYTVFMAGTNHSSKQQKINKAPKPEKHCNFNLSIVVCKIIPTSLRAIVSYSKMASDVSIIVEICDEKMANMRRKTDKT